MHNGYISSLALHHLETDKATQDFYKKIYSVLSSGGVFLNADVILGSTKKLQEAYMQQWISFMGKKVSNEEIANNWIPKYQDEDRPAKLVDQLKWLEEIGYTGVDVIWKYYNHAVHGGYKFWRRYKYHKPGHVEKF